MTLKLLLNKLNCIEIEFVFLQININKCTFVHV